MSNWRTRPPRRPSRALSRSAPAYPPWRTGKTADEQWRTGRASLQNAARACLSDQPASIRRQQRPGFVLLDRGIFHRCNVALVRAVPLLERKPRVVRGFPLRAGFGEPDKAADQVTKIAF